jgi:hypothetical protein
MDQSALDNDLDDYWVKGGFKEKVTAGLDKELEDYQKSNDAGSAQPQ